MHPLPDAIVDAGRQTAENSGEHIMRRMIAALAPAAIGCAKLTIMLGVLATATHSASAGRATLNLVLVLDGLRPDAITPEETPTYGGCAGRASISQTATPSSRP